MKIHDVPQNSDEWFALRCKYPTASEFSNLLTPAKLEPSKAIGDYVATKLAEAWLGGPLQTFTSAAMDQGNIRQHEVRKRYAFEHDVEIATPGFITNDAGTAGCSPDGLITAVRRGMEIKWVEGDTQVAWILAGGLPREHLLQVQGSMLVCGYDEWEFVSGSAGFPTITITVKRDKNICAALESAIGIYWEKFNSGWAVLLDANGGPPEQAVYETTYDDDGTAIKTLKRGFMPDPLKNMMEANCE